MSTFLLELLSRHEVLDPLSALECETCVRSAVEANGARLVMTGWLIEDFDQLLIVAYESGPLSAPRVRRALQELEQFSVRFSRQLRSGKEIGPIIREEV